MGKHSAPRSKMAHRTLFATSLSASLATAICFAQLVAPDSPQFAASAHADNPTTQVSVGYSTTDTDFGVAVYDSSDNAVENGTITSAGSYTAYPTVTIAGTTYVFKANSFAYELNVKDGDGQAVNYADAMSSVTSELSARKSALETFLSGTTRSNDPAYYDFGLKWITDSGYDFASYGFELDSFSTVIGGILELFQGFVNPAYNKLESNQRGQYNAAFGSVIGSLSTTPSTAKDLAVSASKAAKGLLGTSTIVDNAQEANALNLLAKGARDAFLNYMAENLGTTTSDALSSASNTFITRAATLETMREDSASSLLDVASIVQGNYSTAAAYRKVCQDNKALIESSPSETVELLKTIGSTYKLRPDFSAYAKSVANGCGSFASADASFDVTTDGTTSIPAEYKSSALNGNIPGAGEDYSAYMNVLSGKGIDALVTMMKSAVKNKLTDSVNSSWATEIDGLAATDLATFNKALSAIQDKIEGSANFDTRVQNLVTELSNLSTFFADNANYYSAISKVLDSTITTLNSLNQDYENNPNSDTYNNLEQAINKASKTFGSYNTSVLPTKADLSALNDELTEVSKFIFNSSDIQGVVKAYNEADAVGSKTTAPAFTVRFNSASDQTAAKSLLNLFLTGAAFLNAPETKTASEIQTRTSTLKRQLDAVQADADAQYTSNENYKTALSSLNTYRDQLTNGQYDTLLSELNGITDATLLKNFSSNLPKLLQLIKNIQDELKKVEKVKAGPRYTEANANAKNSYDQAVNAAQSTMTNLDNFKTSDISTLQNVLNNLQAGYNGLDGVANVNLALVALNNELRQYSSVVYSEKYRNSTTAVRDAYRSAYEAGKELYDDTNNNVNIATVVQLQQAVIDLQTTRNNLDGKSDLQVAKERIQAAILVNSVVNSGLNSAQKDALAKAMANISNDGDLRTLEKTVLDIARDQGILKETISDANTVTQSSRYAYADSESRRQYDEAISAAQDLVDTKSDVDTSDDLTASQRDIVNAINRLQGVGPSADGLSAAIDDYYGTTASLAFTGSTTDLRLAYVEAVSNGRFILANPDSNDQQMKDATDAIYAAKAKLNGDLPRTIVLWGFGISAAVVLIGYLVAQLINHGIISPSAIGR
ncbi:MAG: hypothetical protein Q3962_03375 [Corynebacterium sp.]|nr:hypothetical protein [Corynebacterium sp.]